MDTAFLLRLAIGIFFICHGIVFPIWGGSYWKFYELETMPYSTRVLWRRFDVGDTGIRILGLLWMLSGIMWMVAGVGLILLTNWWAGFTIATAILTSIPCILALPEGKYGILINLVVLVLVYLNGMYAWL